MKEQPRDDAEVERKEETAIDQVFADASSSEEDEDLTEHGMFLMWKMEESVDVASRCTLCPPGKELKALMKKQLEGEKEEEETEEGQDESFSSPEKDVFKKSEGKRAPSPVKGETESLL